MKVLIELDAEDGELLDKLAEEQDRSRSAQARRMLTKAIWEAANKPLPISNENDN
jgi:predicted transcriptional regulator